MHARCGEARAARCDDHETAEFELLLTTAVNVRLAPVLNAVKGPDTVTVMFGAGFEAVLPPTERSFARLTPTRHYDVAGRISSG